MEIGLIAKERFSQITPLPPQAPVPSSLVGDEISQFQEYYLDEYESDLLEERESKPEVPSHLSVTESNTHVTALPKDQPTVEFAMNLGIAPTGESTTESNTNFIILPTESKPEVPLHQTAAGSNTHIIVFPQDQSVTESSFIILPTDQSTVESVTHQPIKESFTNFAILPSSQTPIYTQLAEPVTPDPHTSIKKELAKPITPTSTDLYKPIIEPITPVKKGCLSKIKNPGFKRHRSFPYPSLPPYPGSK
jgi:hypothetical protein